MNLVIILLFIIIILFICIFYLRNSYDRRMDSLSKGYDEHIISSSTNLNGKITDISKAFCQISGYSKDELIGQNHNIIRHPDMDSEIYSGMWKTIKNDKVWHGEIKNLKKDGGYYWVKAHIYSQYDKNNKKIGYTSIREDITAQKDLEILKSNLELAIQRRVTELNTTNLYLDTIFEAYPDILIVTSGDKIEKVNSKFLNFTKFDSLDDFKEVYKCICDQFENIEGYLQPHIDNNLTWIEYVELHPKDMHKALIIKDDLEYIFSVQSKKMLLDEEVKYIAILTEITNLERLATVDKLTSLYNRRKLDSVLENCSSDGLVDNLCLMMLDIDNFKIVNDKYGHDVGDKVLKSIANSIKENTRDTDIAGRWGGEEFLVICKDTSLEEAKNISNRILNSVRESDFAEIGKQTVSIGLSCLTTDESIVELLKRSDIKLYEAKNSGKDCLKY
ncbi:sensor domain-containing diguanylate cyclase [Sulfurimonas sp.]